MVLTIIWDEVIMERDRREVVNMVAVSGHQYLYLVVDVTRIIEIIIR
jgi:hypothetical protein